MNEYIHVSLMEDRDGFPSGECVAYRPEQAHELVKAGKAVSADADNRKALDKFENANKLTSTKDVDAPNTSPHAEDAPKPGAKKGSRRKKD